MISNGTDAVVLCCKKFSGARSAEDIKAAVEALKQDHGELIKALIKEGPSFKPKAERTGRFSRLGSSATALTKLSALSRASSFARAATVISRESSSASKQDVQENTASPATVNSINEEGVHEEGRNNSSILTFTPSQRSSFGRLNAADGREASSQTSSTVGSVDTAPSLAATRKKTKEDKCDNPACKKLQDDTNKFEIKCLKCAAVKYCGKECQRLHFVAHSKVCKPAPQKTAVSESVGRGDANASMSRAPSETLGLLTQVSSELEETATSATDKTDTAPLKRTNTVWNRVDIAMEDEVDDQGFKSNDERLEYFLRQAKLIRAKPGQKIVEAGYSGGIQEMLFYFVWRGNVGVQRPIPEKSQGWETMAARSLRDPLQVSGNYTPGMNREKTSERGPDSLIRMQSGPGGPAAESKGIEISNASERYEKYKKEVERRRHGEPMVTQKEKEAAFRKKDSDDKGRRSSSDKSDLEKTEHPTERPMGTVPEGSAFGEAECVLNAAFQTSVVGRLAPLTHDTSGESLEAQVQVQSDKIQILKSANASQEEMHAAFEKLKDLKKELRSEQSKESGGIILLALTTSDYLKLWPKRAKLVERAIWLQKQVCFLQAFDLTSIVRVTCAEDIVEQKINPGQKICRKGEVQGLVRVVMSGGFVAQRSVVVDKAVNRVMKIRGEWLGPSDDWENQKMRVEQGAGEKDSLESELRVDPADSNAYPFESYLEEYGEEDGRRRWAMADVVKTAGDVREGGLGQERTEGEEVTSRNQATGLGISGVDQARATRALNRVIGFSGLHTRCGGPISKVPGRKLNRKSHGSSSPKAAAENGSSSSQTTEEKCREVMVDVRWFDRGASFGFWGILFKGETEPSDIVARYDSVVLNIPCATLAKLNTDPELYAKFKENETAVNAALTQRYRKVAQLKRAQVLGRIMATQVRNFSDHLKEVDKQAPIKSIDTDIYLPMSTLSGLEGVVPKIEHMPELARVYTEERKVGGGQRIGAGGGSCGKHNDGSANVKMDGNSSPRPILLNSMVKGREEVAGLGGEAIVGPGAAKKVDLEAEKRAELEKRRGEGQNLMRRNPILAQEITNSGGRVKKEKDEKMLPVKGITNFGGRVDENLLPVELNLETYMQKQYSAAMRLSSSYEICMKDPHLDYFEPIKHHHWKEVQQLLEVRKAPPVVTWEEATQLSYEAAVMQSKVKLLSNREIHVQRQLKAMMNILAERKSAAAKKYVQVLIRKDVFISILRHVGLVLPRSCTKSSSQQLISEGVVLKTLEAMELFDSLAFQCGWSHMTYIDELHYRIAVEKVAAILNVPLPPDHETVNGDDDLFQKCDEEAFVPDSSTQEARVHSPLEDFVYVESMSTDKAEGMERIIGGGVTIVKTPQRDSHVPISPVTNVVVRIDSSQDVVYLKVDGKVAVNEQSGDDGVDDGAVAEDLTRAVEDKGAVVVVEREISDAEAPKSLQTTVPRQRWSARPSTGKSRPSTGKSIVGLQAAKVIDFSLVIQENENVIGGVAIEGKNLVGQEKSADTAGGDKKWTSQFHQYHLPKKRSIPFENSSKNSLLLPIESHHVKMTGKMRPNSCIAQATEAVERSASVSHFSQRSLQKYEHALVHKLNSEVNLGRNSMAHVANVGFKPRREAFTYGEKMFSKLNNGSSIQQSKQSFRQEGAVVSSSDDPLPRPATSQGFHSRPVTREALLPRPSTPSLIPNIQRFRPKSPTSRIPSHDKDDSFRVLASPVVGWAGHARTDSKNPSRRDSQEEIFQEFQEFPLLSQEFQELPLETFSRVSRVSS